MKFEGEDPSQGPWYVGVIETVLSAVVMVLFWMIALYLLLWGFGTYFL